MSTKKYIVLIIFITAVIVGPFAYQRWREARRLTQIKQVKQQASQINAISLVDFLEELKNTSKDSTLLLLYTGNTQAHLEPCGCFIGQSGGLPRRATTISRIRAQGFSPALVDLGGLLPPQIPKMTKSSSQQISRSDEETATSPDSGIHSLDQLRTQTTLAAMSLMEYDALVPAKTETNFGADFVKAFLANQSFPLLAANIETPALNVHPILWKTIGNKKIALIGLSSLENPSSTLWETALSPLLPKLQNEADFVVLLSNLSKGTNREIAGKYPFISAILSHQTGETERIGEVLLAYSYSKGKTLGALTLSDDAGPYIATAQQIALTEAVEDDPKVRDLLKNFYEKVKNNPRLQDRVQPLFADQALEQNAKNTYIGSQTCKECHQKELNQWAHTSHAVAFNTLRSVGREFYPECVSCHVTGFGYKTGYQIDNPKRAHLAEVGCETCHGPGKQHVYNPLKENIRGEVGQKICADCHRPDHSPGFDLIVQQLMPEVDHSRTQPSLKTIIDQRLRGPMKPEVELFVMSYCPFGVQAEQELLPFLSKYGDAIDFKLRFIAREAEEDVEAEFPFTSLHGETELIEDLRQMVIAELYPDKLFDYLLCRADHLQEAWTKCAQKYGIDVDKITKELEGEAIKQRFLQEIRRTEELGIVGSPTLVIDGREIFGGIWRGKVRETCR